MQEPKYTNQLIHEKSPYLQQHAHNPVNWFPWGKEAFALAQEKDRPIFLSIGYSSCHWCQVMERQVFRDPKIAELMNQTFINVKVDREELPEVDGLYMEFAQSMMAGMAGWPLNLILTPDLYPFYAASFLPPKAEGGQLGVQELIQQMAQIWVTEEKEKVSEQAERIVEAFSMTEDYVGASLPDQNVLKKAAELYFKIADPTYGGSSGIPKFPVGYHSSFLLRYAERHEEGRALYYVQTSLRMMERGGIYDQLGGGFSRYAMDAEWLVPHFEKMLYDNAILAYGYLELWQVSRDPEYRKVCEETLNYLLKELKSPGGAFYSSESADSEGREGHFYTWTPEEIREVVGEAEMPMVCEYYGVSSRGNFQGRSILHVEQDIHTLAALWKMDPLELETKLETQKKLLLAARNKREHPRKDKKILGGWNGLAIHTLAIAGVVLDEKNYREAAERAAEFLQKHLWVGRELLRRWCEGESRFIAGLDDYAYLIRAALTLHETSTHSHWLLWAMEMTQTLEERFKVEGGAFYQNDGSDPYLLLRRCRFMDGAEPSGNGVHAENLLRLYQMSGNPSYLNQAKEILKAVASRITSYPPGYSYHLLALQRFYDESKVRFHVALNEEEEGKEELRRLLFHRLLRQQVVLWSRPEEEDLKQMIPHLRDEPCIDQKTTLYVQIEGQVQEPMTDLSQMIRKISEW